MELIDRAVIQVKTESELNGGHGSRWAVTQRRRLHRRLGLLNCPRFVLPCVVRMTRASAGELDDDNLRAAMKSLRDGLADRMEIGDNDPRVIWEYGQSKCQRGQYFVTVEIFSQ